MTRAHLLVAAVAASAFSAVLGCQGDRPVSTDPGAALLPSGDTVILLTWNLGYAGLGADSDFFVDLGQQRRVPSAASVERNLAGILQTLVMANADVLLLQEVAAPSYVNHRRDVRAAVAAALPDYQYLYQPEFRTVLVPPPFSLAVGQGTYTRLDGSMERRRLDGETEVYWGVARRDFSAHLLRTTGPSRWSFFNLHVSAFDEVTTGLREAQARQAIAWGEAEFREGRCVVIGGDWNMRLTATDFPHRTPERFQFWLRDLPEDLAPPGWRWAFDPRAPTVRTLHAPFQEGVTYQTIVDGFLVSPNVVVREAETLDLRFQWSDHNPARLVVRAEGC